MSHNGDTSRFFWLDSTARVSLPPADVRKQNLGNDERYSMRSIRSLLTFRQV